MQHPTTESKSDPTGTWEPAGFLERLGDADPAVADRAREEFLSAGVAGLDWLRDVLAGPEQAPAPAPIGRFHPGVTPVDGPIFLVVAIVLSADEGQRLVGLGFIGAACFLLWIRARQRRAREAAATVTIPSGAEECRRGLQRLRSLVAALLLCFLSGSGFHGSVSAALGRAERAEELRRESAVDRDSRLRNKLISLPPRAGVSAGWIVRKLEEATGVPLLCESGLTPRPIAVLVSLEVSVVELMKSVGYSAHARWVRVGKGYMLCRMPELIDITSRSEAEVERERGTVLRELLASLTVEQKSHLEGGGAVQYERFTPQQKQLARRCWALSLIEATDTYRPEGLSGHGLYFRLGAGPDASQRSFELFGPGYWADPISNIAPPYPG